MLTESEIELLRQSMVEIAARYEAQRERAAK